MPAQNNYTTYAETNILTGLTDTQIAQAPKNIPLHHVSDIVLIMTVIKSQLMSFFCLLLVLSGVLSLFLGHTVDATIFFVISAINVIIGTIQEFRANKSTQVLEQLITHHVSVRRNSTVQEIESTNVVCGDIVIAEAGDVVVADMIIRESCDVLIDESVLTGETMPKAFVVGETVFAGTHIVQGSLVGQVVAVGKKSSLLMYAEKLSHTVKNSSFETFVRKISMYIVIMTVSCLAFVFVANVLIHHSINLSEYLLYAVAMLVGVVPESLPLIITIILTREALVLAKNDVIVKKLSVLQNLGSMDYFFTDKTGTITENKLHVGGVLNISNVFQKYLTTIAFGTYKRTPMDSTFDTAIMSYCNDTFCKEDGVAEGGGREDAVDLHISPFQITRGFSIYTLPDGQEIIRGHYEYICTVCGPVATNDTDTTSDIARVQVYCRNAEEQGMRTITFAQKEAGASSYTLLGVVCFEDTIKQDAPALYNALRNLLVRVKIITGDSVSVAQYIGNKIDALFR